MINWWWILVLTVFDLENYNQMNNIYRNNDKAWIENIIIIEIEKVDFSFLVTLNNYKKLKSE